MVTLMPKVLNFRKGGMENTAQDQILQAVFSRTLDLKGTKNKLDLGGKQLKKARNKRISLLMTIVFMLTIMIPVAAPAATSASISAMTTPIVSDLNNQTLGTIKVTVPAGTIQTGDSVIFKIPDGWDFATPVVVNVGGSIAVPATNSAMNVAGAADNRVFVPVNYQNTANPAADINGLAANEIQVDVLDANDEIQLTALADQSLTNDFVFYAYMRDVNVESGKTGDCTVTFDGLTGSGFPMGTVVNARVESAGSVTITVSGTDTSNNNFNFDMRVKENVRGSLELGNDTLELTLPDGYVWTTGARANEVSGIPGAILRNLMGEAITYDVNINPAGDELTIDFNNVGGVVRATNVASYWEFAGLAFTVDDEDQIDEGDVVMEIAGESTINISEAVVGKYGDFGATIAVVGDVPEIVAGFEEQEIAEINVEELIAGSLLEGRTVTLQLPENARWQRDVDGNAAPANSDADHGLTLNGTDYTGTNDRMAKYDVNVAGVATLTTDEAKVSLEDVEVLVEPGFTGDLVVTVGGSAGVSGEIVVAKVVSPFSVKAENLNTLQIGKSGQAIGDIIISENIAGAFEEANVRLLVPQNIEWDNIPTVEVIEGNAKIESGSVTRATFNTYQDILQFNIQRDSTIASKIKVSGAELKLDRTIPEGNINVQLTGFAVMDAAASIEWPNTDYAAEGAIATVGTPAPVETTAEVSFTSGQDGVYIENGRMMVQVNLLDELGITKAWDATTKTAYFFNGAKVVAFPIGKALVNVQGVANITLEAPNKVIDGNTYVALRGLEYLGVGLEWNADTKTATATLK